MRLLLPAVCTKQRACYAPLAELYLGIAADAALSRLLKPGRPLPQARYAVSGRSPLPLSRGTVHAGRLVSKAPVVLQTVASLHHPDTLELLGQSGAAALPLPCQLHRSIACTLSRIAVPFFESRHS